MTADGTEPEAQRATGRGAASAKAYERRNRRQGTAVPARLTRTGSPVAAAMSRVPFVATIMLLLAAGIVGVLWLNTMSDATGLQATASRIRQADVKTSIEALQRDVNTLRDPARLAAEASRLGLVPAGDAAMLNIGADGKATVIGTPTQVPGQARAAAPATTAPASTTPPATTPPPVTAPATTAAAAAKAVPASTSARPSPTATAATTTLPKTAPTRTPPVKTTAAPTTAATTTAAPTAAAQQSTTTTGAGR